MTEERSDWINRSEILREPDAHQKWISCYGSGAATLAPLRLSSLLRRLRATRSENELASLERARRNLKGQRRHTPEQLAKNERRIQIWRTQARNHHVHRNARLGSRRSSVMTFGIRSLEGLVIVLGGQRSTKNGSS